MTTFGYYVILALVLAELGFLNNAMLHVLMNRKPLRSVLTRIWRRYLWTSLCFGEGYKSLCGLRTFDIRFHGNCAGLATFVWLAVSTRATPVGAVGGGIVAGLAVSLAGWLMNFRTLAYKAAEVDYRTYAAKHLQ